MRNQRWSRLKVRVLPGLKFFYHFLHSDCNFLFKSRSLVLLDTKELTQAGLEPTISCSVGRRLIHWATEPSKVLRHQKSIFSASKFYFNFIWLENHVGSRLIHAIQFSYFPSSKFNILILSLRFSII